MSGFIEDFYYGNIEPQECTTHLTAKVKKSLSELSGKEEHLTSILTDKEQELFTDYVATYIKFSKPLQCRQLHRRLQTRGTLHIRHFY